MNLSANGMWHLAKLSSSHPGFWENVQYQAIGLLIVFVVLGLIWGCMFVSGALFRLLPTNVRDPGREAQPSAAAAGGKVDPRTVAVLAAAVHAAVGEPHRILSIDAGGHAQGTHSPWSAEGRRQIFLSHRVR